MDEFNKLKVKALLKLTKKSLKLSKKLADFRQKYMRFTAILFLLLVFSWALVEQFSQYGIWINIIISCAISISLTFFITYIQRGGSKEEKIEENEEKNEKKIDRLETLRTKRHDEALKLHEKGLEKEAEKRFEYCRKLDDEILSLYINDAPLELKNVNPVELPKDEEEPPKQKETIQNKK